MLVVGGISGPSGYAQYLTSAEVYDPATGTWSAAGSISKPLVAATLLRDGKVLVLVGDVDGGPRSAEVYDPARGTWTATGPMDPSAEESDGTLTVLQDGRVLLAGRDGAQVYDPASGPGPPPVRWLGFAVSRHVHGAPRRPGPGGWWGRRPGVRPGQWDLDRHREEERTRAMVQRPSCCPTAKSSLRAAAAFDSPNNVLRSRLGRGIRPRHGVLDRDREHAREGRCPWRPSCSPMARCWWSDTVRHAEVYDPATGTWTALPVRPGIGYSTATLLSDGTVLVTGDADAAGLYRGGPVRPTHRVVDDRLDHAWVRPALAHAPARRHGPRGGWQRLQRRR